MSGSGGIVMVNDMGNRNGVRSSNPDQGCLRSLDAYALSKSMDQFIQLSSCF